MSTYARYTGLSLGGGGGGGGADTNAIYRDGSQPPTAAIPWNDQDLTGVAVFEASRAMAPWRVGNSPITSEGVVGPGAAVFGDEAATVTTNVATIGTNSSTSFLGSLTTYNSTSSDPGFMGFAYALGEGLTPMGEPRLQFQSLFTDPSVDFKATIFFPSDGNLYLADYLGAGTGNILFSSFGLTSAGGSIGSLTNPVAKGPYNIYSSADGVGELGNEADGRFQNAYFGNLVKVGDGTLDPASVFHGQRNGNAEIRVITTDSASFAQSIAQNDLGNIHNFQILGSAFAGGFPFNADAAVHLTNGTAGLNIISGLADIHFVTGGYTSSDEVLRLSPTATTVVKGSLLINELELELNSSAASAATSVIHTGADDGQLIVAGGGGAGDPNGAIVLYGSTASFPKGIRFFTDSANVGEINDNGQWTIGEVATTQSQAINSAEEPAGADVLTMTNGPTGTAGDPDVYLRLVINGVTYVFPGWAV